MFQFQVDCLIRSFTGWCNVLGMGTVDFNNLDFKGMAFQIRSCGPDSWSYNFCTDCSTNHDSCADHYAANFDPDCEANHDDSPDCGSDALCASHCSPNHDSYTLDNPDTNWIGPYHQTTADSRALHAD
jgi:hypothetical protein